MAALETVLQKRIAQRKFDTSILHRRMPIDNRSFAGIDDGLLPIAPGKYGLTLALTVNSDLS